MRMRQCDHIQPLQFSIKDISVVSADCETAANIAHKIKKMAREGQIEKVSKFSVIFDMIEIILNEISWQSK